MKNEECKIGDKVTIIPNPDLGEYIIVEKQKQACTLQNDKGHVIHYFPYDLLIL